MPVSNLIALIVHYRAMAAGNEYHEDLRNELHKRAVELEEQLYQRDQERSM